MAGIKYRGRSVILAISAAVQTGSGIYLLTSDQYLKLSGNSLHWDALLTFCVVDAVLLVSLLAGKGVLQKIAAGVWSAVGAAAILGDAASNLALSSFHTSAPYAGWKYLFGFGRVSGSGSVFGTSVAVTAILIFCVISIMAAIHSARQSGRSA